MKKRVSKRALDIFFSQLIKPSQHLINGPVFGSRPCQFLEGAFSCQYNDETI
jgi:hypothetical protein